MGILLAEIDKSGARGEMYLRPCRTGLLGHGDSQAGFWKSLEEGPGQVC